MAIRHGAHRKLTARNPDHPFRRFATGLVRGLGTCRERERTREDQ